MRVATAITGRKRILNSVRRKRRTRSRNSSAISFWKVSAGIRSGFSKRTMQRDRTIFYRAKSKKKNVSRLHAKEVALERLDREPVLKRREAAQLKMNLDGEGFSASTLLRMEDVHFAYEGERELLRQFDFAVNRGDRIAVIGPNGTGKSTLLKLIAGVSSPSSGSVRLHPQTKNRLFCTRAR